MKKTELKINLKIGYLNIKNQIIKFINKKDIIKHTNIKIKKPNRGQTYVKLHTTCDDIRTINDDTRSVYSNATSFGRFKTPRKFRSRLMGTLAVFIENLLYREGVKESKKGIIQQI
jgi:hypothetical protein